MLEKESPVVLPEGSELKLATDKEIAHLEQIIKDYNEVLETPNRIKDFIVRTKANQYVMDKISKMSNKWRDKVKKGQLKLQVPEIPEPDQEEMEGASNYIKLQIAKYEDLLQYVKAKRSEASESEAVCEGGGSTPDNGDVLHQEQTGESSSKA
ncbi:MAG: hypothetical protein BWY14_01027 [Parcubacteria group bacterium ADurb.Bin192]|nr:MAG: hypothetical protein BWY14_01027 [Parcubacteria group bacterium ADurb.Bin192]